jgi:hypothetical protein
MAIFNLHLDVDKNYTQFANDIYKTLTILIVIQLLFSLLDTNKEFLTQAISGNILNEEFMTLLLIIILGISSYYLIFNKILEIN